MPAPKPNRAQIVEQVLFALRKGHALKAACGFAGVARRTVADWMTADPKLAEAVEIARGKGQHLLEELALAPDVAGPSSTILRGRLGAMDAEEWGDRRVEINGGNLRSLADLAAEDEAACRTSPP